MMINTLESHHTYARTYARTHTMHARHPDPVKADLFRPCIPLTANRFYFATQEVLSLLSVTTLLITMCNVASKLENLRVRDEKRKEELWDTNNVKWKLLSTTCWVRTMASQSNHGLASRPTLSCTGAPADGMETVLTVQSSLTMLHITTLSQTHLLMHLLWY